MTRHANANTHMTTWRHAHAKHYNQYQKEIMRKVRLWKKIQMEFLSILL